MARLQAGGYTRAGIPSCVHDMLSIMMLGFIEQRLDSWLREAPCTRVQWLLLTPNNSLGIRVHVEVLPELSPWEWVQLFDASNGRVLEIIDIIGTMLVQRGVHLTAAKNDPINLLWW